jgi:hypothetical protein
MSDDKNKFRGLLTLALENPPLENAATPEGYEDLCALGERCKGHFVRPANPNTKH